MTDEPKTVRGRRIDLDDHRYVFVGFADDDPDIYVRFQNGEVATRFRLSTEASLAFRKLLIVAAGDRMTFIHDDGDWVQV